ncbi:MAG: transposase, partial [Gammaproteobacteria bacterium]|nr:transposase [Gammaproteobacteria bacterium]MDX2459704.1 transposase [Gammaproteobacteria bacterium]
MQTTPPEQGQKPNPEQLMLLPAGDDECIAPGRQTPTAAGVSKAIRSRRYKRGPEAAQPMLLPPSVDDYVAADSPVRAIKAYVDTLNFKTLGFKNTEGELKAGQPAFDPADLLELYLYGYLNRVRSSRRLEAECVRNLEVIWLLNGLRPGYHTIADFRKNNADALKAANSTFVQLCRELELFGGKLIGIDGSFFNGDASHASVTTKTQLQAELEATKRDIERYQQELDDNDTAEADQPGDAVTSAEKLAALEARAKKKSQQIERLEKSGETQLSRTDPDARRLAKDGKKVTG